MTRYIVKNCPMFVSGKPNKCLAYTRGICHTKVDCLIKKVIDKCREVECPCELEGVDCLECGEKRRKTFADDILKLFEIEECE